MNTAPTHNSLVVKHNDLIGQMAKFELSELRLIAYCLAHYDSRKEDNRTFRARVEDFAELFPIDFKSAYRVIRQTMLNLGKKPLEFQEGRKRYYWNWFSGFTYDEGNGEFEFKITPEIQPYLLKLSGTFTRYRLRDVYQFKAASTWKLYELLKQWATARKLAVDLNQLRLLLGVAGKYPKWYPFEVRLIAPAVKEINEVSDLIVSYQQEKRGRQVVGIVFFIDLKKPGDEDVILIESNEDKLLKNLLEHGITQKTAEQLVCKAEYGNKVDRLIELLPAMVKRAQNAGAAKAKYVTGAINQELNQLSLLEEQPKEQKLPPQQHHELSYPEVIIFPGMKLKEKITKQIWIVEDGNTISSFAGYTLFEKDIKQYITDGVFTII